MNVPVEGDVLAGKYRVERILGQGGMGIVVAATHLQLGQRVAIKFLIQNATKEIVTRFIREARAAVRLKSEHVARVLDVGDLPDGAPYMVMEYLEGNDLSHVVRSQGALPVADAVLYLLHTCEAIAEAHSIGIIHRDLKPANLFLTRGPDGSNTVKVLDFGISKTLDEQAEGGDGMQLTQTTTVLGSPLYMSPEQMQSARGVTVQSDIWSLGAILYQLLATKVPFDTTTFSQLILMVNMHQPPPMTTFRSDVPPGLEAAILRCLEKKPDGRFANVGELAWAIAAHGPPEARTSAEKTARTLEATGVRVSRTSEISGIHAAPPAPAVSPERSATSTSIVALASSADPASHRSRSKGPLVIAGIAVGVAVAATAVILSMRSPSHPPERSVASALLAETAPLPTAVALATASAAPEPTVVPALPPPPPEASATAVVAAPKTTGQPGTARPAGLPKAPTAAPAATPKNTLDMKIKD